MKKVLFAILNCLTTIVILANPLANRYLDTYKDIAIAEMHRSGIPASIKLAQGMIESDMGRSPLATKANNHFGIKCGRDWQGETFYRLDDDRDSTGTIKESCFRAYSNPQESYLAHSAFLSNPAKQSRYGFLFKLPTTDYSGWANGLKMAGYATDPAYPNKLTKIINLYKLYQYDEDIIRIQPADPELLADVANSSKSEPSSPANTKKKENDKTDKVKSNSSPTSKTETGPKKNSTRYMIDRINSVEFVTCTGGESIAEIAKSQKVDVYDLLSYNEGVNSPYTIMDRDQKVFLQRKKSSSMSKWHTVTKGESLFDISQKYGIRLQSLAIKNNVKPIAIIAPGQKVSLNRQLSRKETPKHTYDAQFDHFIDMGE